MKTQPMPKGEDKVPLAAARAIPAATLRPWMTLLGAAAAEVPAVHILAAATVGLGGTLTAPPQPTSTGGPMWAASHPCPLTPADMHLPGEGVGSGSGDVEGSEDGSPAGEGVEAANASDHFTNHNDDEDDYEWKPPPPTCTLCGKHDHPNDCFRSVRAVHVHWARVMELEVRGCGLSCGWKKRKPK